MTFFFVYGIYGVGTKHGLTRLEHTAHHLANHLGDLALYLTVINHYLQRHDRRRTSYTHAYAASVLLHQFPNRFAHPAHIDLVPTDRV